MSLSGKLARLTPALVVGPLLGLAATASAQKPVPGPSATTTASVSASASGSAKPAAAAASIETPSIGSGASYTSFPVVPNGLTAEVAATRALKTSKTAKVDEAKLKAAGAQVDLAWDAYLPKLSLLARYTRLSPLDPQSLGSGSLVATPAPPGTFNPTPTIAAALTFPVLLNQYTAQASLLVPLSDYAFRIYHQHDSALANVEAVKWNAKVSSSQTGADARIAFYNLLRARGGVIIARSAVAQSQGHLKDLKARLGLKDATVADVARVEAQLAAAELAVVRSENLVIITETNLRVLMHSGDEEDIALGEDLDNEIPKLTGELKTLRASALSNRPELKAIDAQLTAAEKTVSVAAAGMYPRLDASGNLTYQNPNTRIFPAQEKFTATWDVSLQLSWSPNDALISSDNKKVASGNVAVLKATREQLEDAFTLDVTNAFTRVREAEAAVISTAAERRAAEEAYRVRLEQFRAGIAVSSFLIDAEADVTRARLNELNARVDLRIARVQLKKAIGEI
jgi:outer membrane protein